jgi:hypothetical protein
MHPFTCNRASGLIFRAIILFSLVTIGSGCSLKRDTTPSLPGPETAGESTGMSQSGKTTTWESADATAKRQFIAEYKANPTDIRPVYQKYLPILGVGAILDYLEKRFPFCHGEAHDLGRELYAQTRDIGESLSLCGNRCTAGCMHGVIGEAFGGQLHEDVASRMDGACQSGEMLRDHKPGNCAHAMGHALMLSSNGDLAYSLSACKQFKQPGMDYYCATGVYMQYHAFLEEGKSPPDEQLLSATCGNEKRFPAACYLFMLQTVGSDAARDDREKWITTCLSLPDIHHQRGCFHGLGKRYSIPMAKWPDLLPKICGHGDAETQILCIEGAIQKLADYNSTLAEQVCNALSGNHRETCLAATRYKMYSLDKPTLKLYRPHEKDGS